MRLPSRFLELGTGTGIGTAWLLAGMDPEAWPGKFAHLNVALSLLRVGGIYFIDDLLPQPNWPEGHAPKVPALVDDIEKHPEFTTVRLSWASGLMIAVRMISRSG